MIKRVLNHIPNIYKYYNNKYCLCVYVRPAFSWFLIIFDWWLCYWNMTWTSDAKQRWNIGLRSWQSGPLNSLPLMSSKAVWLACELMLTLQNRHVFKKNKNVNFEDQLCKSETFTAFFCSLKCFADWEQSDCTDLWETHWKGIVLRLNTHTYA